METRKKVLLIAAPSLVLFLAYQIAAAEPPLKLKPQNDAAAAARSAADGLKIEPAGNCEESADAAATDSNIKGEENSMTTAAGNKTTSPGNLAEIEGDLKNKPDSYWRERLDPKVYQVTRQGGTEARFSGLYYHFKEQGLYRCSNCGAPLFSSDTKYDSGSGWPSFYQSVDPEAVILKKDDTHDMLRTEVLCSRCGAHLGHVFEDGPAPTGQRFCINSLSLQHEKIPAEGIGSGSAERSEKGAKAGK